MALTVRWNQQTSAQMFFIWDRLTLSLLNANFPETSYINQGLANFFWIGPGSKYCRLCTPKGHIQSLSQPSGSAFLV